MLILTRKEAITMGLNKYFTGKPCSNGHVSERYVQSGSCSQCINGTAISSRIEKSETLNEAANKLEMTALSDYNENLKRITKMYEETLVKAQQLRDKALNKINIEQTVADHRELQAEVDNLVKITVEYKPENRKELEAYYLSLLQRHNPNFTLDTLRYRNKMKGNNWFEIRCHPSDVDTITSRHVVHAVKPQS